MSVGYDVAVGVEHHSGTGAAFGLDTAGAGIFGVPQALHVDLHHRGTNLLHQALERLAEPSQGRRLGILRRKAQRQDKPDKQPVYVY